MNKLNLFTLFDWPAFAKGKAFLCTGCKPWDDYDTKAHMGTKVEAVIYEDNTDYGEEAGTVSNLFEKITFKVAQDITVPIGVFIVPKGVKATVYGDYRNQLSCIADSITIQKES